MSPPIRAISPLLLLFRIVVVAMVVLVIYLALRPTAHLDDLNWMPGWLAHWLLAHDFAKNSAAFAVLGLALTRAWPERTNAGSGPHPAWGVWFLLTVLVLGLEPLQWLLTSRGMEWQDVAARAAGVIIAWAFMATFNKLHVQHTS